MIIRGRAYVKDEVREVSIAVEDGYIKNIRSTSFYTDDEVYDFSRPGLLILPGMVDIHVHLRDFDYGYKEDFYSGSSAAAAGGVSVVVDMPNTRPRVDRLHMLWYRDCVASMNTVVDYGLYYGVPHVLDELEGYEETAIGMKFFPEDMEKPYELLDVVFRYNASKDILTIFHPEDPVFLKKGVRPPEAEVKAAVDIAKITMEYGLKTHLTHISTVESLETARRIYRGFTADTCPHYLLLSSDDYTSSYYRVYPPLRSSDMRLQLLKHFTTGDIEMLSTDHAPHDIDEKLCESPWGGFPGLETALPLLLTLFKKDVISLGRIVEAYSMNPARLIGFDNLLGSIEVGKLANLTIVDIDSSYKIDPSKFFSKARHSPFEGWTVYGRVVATFVRGKPVYMDGEIIVERGYGENIIGLRRM